jgi:hypothetical protein
MIINPIGCGRGVISPRALLRPSERSYSSKLPKAEEAYLLKGFPDVVFHDKDKHKKMRCELSPAQLCRADERAEGQKILPCNAFHYLPSKHGSGPRPFTWVRRRCAVAIERFARTDDDR